MLGSADCIAYVLEANSDETKSIFKSTQTINLMVKNFKQSERMIEQLKSIFGSTEKSFVIFNFF